MIGAIIIILLLVVFAIYVFILVTPDISTDNSNKIVFKKCKSIDDDEDCRISCDEKYKKSREGTSTLYKRSEIEKQMIQLTSIYDLDTEELTFEEIDGGEDSFIKYILTEESVKYAIPPCEDLFDRTAYYFGYEKD